MLVLRNFLCARRIRRYNGIGGRSASGAGLNPVEEPKVDGDANSLMVCRMMHVIQAESCRESIIIGFEEQPLSYREILHGDIIARSG